MKVQIQKQELLTHRKYLAAAKPTIKKVAKNSRITITAAENFSVTGLGFRHDMNCKTFQWGTVSLPYTLWNSLIENLVPVLDDEEITLAAETFEIHFAKTKIENAGIQVSRLDRLSLEIPHDAKPLDIVRFALTRDVRELRASVVWDTIRVARDQIRRQFERAAGPVRRYGVWPQDIALLAAKRIEIEDCDRFIEFLFSDKTK